MAMEAPTASDDDIAVDSGAPAAGTDKSDASGDEAEEQKSGDMEDEKDKASDVEGDKASDVEPETRASPQPAEEEDEATDDKDQNDDDRPTDGKSTETDRDDDAGQHKRLKEPTCDKARPMPPGKQRKTQPEAETTRSVATPLSKNRKDDKAKQTALKKSIKKFLEEDDMKSATAAIKELESMGDTPQHQLIQQESHEDVSHKRKHNEMSPASKTTDEMQSNPYAVETKTNRIAELEKKIATEVTNANYATAFLLQTQLKDLMGCSIEDDSKRPRSINRAVIEKQIALKTTTKDYAGVTRLVTELKELDKRQDRHAVQEKVALMEQEMKTKADNGDYAGAAALKTRLNALQVELSAEVQSEQVDKRELDRKILKLKEQIDVKAKDGDYAAAATMKEELTALETTEEAATESAQVAKRERERKLRKLKDQINAKVKDGDYAAAATMKEELTALETTEEVATESKQVAKRERERKVQHLQELIDAKVKDGDYAAAATMKDELTALEITEDVATSSQAKRRRIEIDQEIQAKLDNQDYAAAALLQAEQKALDDTTESQPRPKSPDHQPIARRHETAKTVEISQLLRTDTPMPSLVKLDSVHVLSVGRISSVKGKGKGKNKDKAKGKSKGKDGTREDVRVAYLGQDGYVVCAAAFGPNAAKIPTAVSQGLVNVTNLHPKPGNIGMLQWDDQTSLIKVLAEYDYPSPIEFPYDTSTISHDFATWAYIQECPVNDYVSLVVSVLTVEIKWTDKQEPFVVIYAKDMDGRTTGALRLWRHEEGDVEQGCLYIIRGLKVELAKTWSYELGKYVPRDDGAKTADCSWRTALEDVTQVKAIQAKFYQ